MINEFFDEWQLLADSDDGQEHRENMIEIMRKYVWNRYPDTEDKEILICSLKRDFGSDLPPAIVAEAIDCDVNVVRRFRYTHDRGVIDTYGGERRSIPPSKRAQILERDNHSCVRCPARDGEYTLQLHHIIPKSHGGVDHTDNLAMLCEECHLDAHCGDFNSRSLAYEDKEQFWDEFCSWEE